jgi:hypothetical protein
MSGGKVVELKNKKNDGSVEGFLNSVEILKKREDSFKILEMMKQITQVEPKMWGDSLIGFGSVKYHYSSGEEGEWFQVGFSPRKQNLSLYLWGMYAKINTETYQNLFSQLGKHKLGKGCLYVNKLDDVNLNILKELISLSFREAQ